MSKIWTSGITGSIIEGPKEIDSLNFSLHYASCVAWEGIRAYRQHDGSTKIFRLAQHIQRLHDSAKILGFEIPSSVAQISEGCKQLVEAHGGGDLYLRPIVYSKQDAESVRVKPSVINVDVYCFPVPSSPDSSEGLKVSIPGFIRGYPQFQMQAKTPANYSMAQAVKLEMDARKVDDVFLLDNLGYVVEATIANILVIHGDLIMTPPNNGSILPGITRRALIEILQDQSKMFAKYNKVPYVIEKNLTKADVYTADEILLCGTYMEVKNVKEVDGRSPNNSKNGFYYKLLKAEYDSLVRGRNENP